MRPSSASRKASLKTRDFSLRFEMTGRKNEMTAGAGVSTFALSGTLRIPNLISTYPRCVQEPAFDPAKICIYEFLPY